LDEIHHQVGIAVLLKEICHTHEMGVVETREDLRLLLKLLPEFGQFLGIEPWLGDHLLERSRHIKPRVPGTVDGAHSSLSQPSDDAIATL
jgi:hypothetical protein